MGSPEDNFELGRHFFLGHTSDSAKVEQDGQLVDALIVHYYFLCRRYTEALISDTVTPEFIAYLTSLEKQWVEVSRLAQHKSIWLTPWSSRGKSTDDGQT